MISLDLFFYISSTDIIFTLRFNCQYNPIYYNNFLYVRVSYNNYYLTLYLLVYQVKQTPSIIIILQRSLCLQGKQQFFSQQLYKLLKGDDFQIRNCIIITGGSLEEIDPLVYSNDSSKKLFYICSNIINSSDDGDNNNSDSNSSSDISSSNSRWKVKYAELFKMFKQRYINIRYAIRDTAEMNISSIKLDDDDHDDISYGISSNSRDNRDNLYDMQQGSMFKNPTTTSNSTVSFYPKGMIAVKYLIEAIESDNRDVVDNERVDNHVGTCKRMNVIVIGKLLHEGDNINDGLELAVEVMNALRLYDNTSLSLQLPPPPTIFPLSSSSIEQTSSTIQSSHYTINQMKHPLSWQSIYGKKLMNDDYTMIY